MCLAIMACAVCWKKVLMRNPLNVLGGNLGDFGEFCKGLILYIVQTQCKTTLPKGILMFKTLKSIWQGLTQKGKIFPHQLAFTLLIPLRNWALSPQQIVQRLHLAPHHRILEVGCGAGYFSPKLAQSVPQGRLVAADIQPEMLAYTEKRLRRRHIDNVDYYLCDGTHFDFPDQSFDRIVLITVLGEVANQAEYLAEFRRLLRPDGLLSVGFRNGRRPR